MVLFMCTNTNEKLSQKSVYFLCEQVPNIHKILSLHCEFFSACASLVYSWEDIRVTLVLTCHH